MKGLILAAGRGSRLGDITSEQPKCLVKLHGQPLVEWQLSALRGAGLDDIVIVTGYKGEMLGNRGARTVINPKWSTTNMVMSLLCAKEEFDTAVIVSYSDIVYSPDVVKKLMGTEGDFVIAYDTAWYDLWQRRFDDPLSDAESFSIDSDGHVVDIGRRVTDLEEINGQYMGLMKITPQAMAWIREYVRTLPGDASSLDMTSLLQGLIAAGRVVTGMPTEGNWCEIDDPADLLVAERLVDEGILRLTGVG